MRSSPMAVRGRAMTEALWAAVSDKALRDRLSAGARASVEREHNWDHKAVQILSLVSARGTHR